MNPDKYSSLVANYPKWPNPSDLLRNKRNFLAVSKITKLLGWGQVMPRIRQQPNWMGVIVGSLGFWLFPTVLSTIPAFSAEQISVFYGPLEFSLSVDDVAAFAKEGKITDDLATYTGSLDAKTLAQLREILQRKLPINSTGVSQLTEAELGKILLAKMGTVLQTETGENGANALRTGLIAAAGDSEGLTFLNLLRKFPQRTMRVNLNLALEIMDQFGKLAKDKEAIIKLIEREATTEATTAEKVNLAERPDLRQLGSFRWDKQTLTLNDRVRDRSLMVDVYLPQLIPQSANQANSNLTNSHSPLIVISHGAAGDRATFAYLAEHLASYGFAVAVIEHPGDNSKVFQQFFTGLRGLPQPIELINRPLEIKFVLDELERLEKSDRAFQGKFNPQQVGIIGHSIGGYTALALAGAKINFEQLKKDCNDSNILNLSLLVQCEANQLPLSNYTLQDERIKAVIVVNPLTSSIFGESSLSQLKLPLMLVASGNDIFTPALPEQILPFTWLSSASKYLVLVEKATHFSFAGETALSTNPLPLTPELIGLNPALSRPYLSALSTAFFDTYLAGKPEYRTYLNAGYTQSISQENLPIRLIKSLTNTQLLEAIETSDRVNIKGDKYQRNKVQLNIRKHL